MDLRKILDDINQTYFRYKPAIYRVLVVDKDGYTREEIVFDMDDIKQDKWVKKYTILDMYSEEVDHDKQSA